MRDLHSMNYRDRGHCGNISRDGHNVRAEDHHEDLGSSRVLRRNHPCTGFHGKKEDENQSPGCAGAIAPNYRGAPSVEGVGRGIRLLAGKDWDRLEELKGGFWAENSQCTHLLDTILQVQDLSGNCEEEVAVVVLHSILRSARTLDCFADVRSSIRHQDHETPTTCHG